MEYEQITQLWQNFITHKLSESKTSFSEEVTNFFKQSRVDFLDIEELDYLEYGQILVRYFDLIYREEEVEVRLVESLDEKFASQWGFMGKDEQKHFDKWLQKRFSLKKTEITELLSFVDAFLHAVLKKQA